MQDVDSVRKSAVGAYNRGSDGKMKVPEFGARNEESKYGTTGRSQKASDYNVSRRSDAVLTRQAIAGARPGLTA